MFIYTKDSILNVDNMLGLSINIMRGAKLTCPAIFLNQVDGKSVVLIQCNTTEQCHTILKDIKHHINNNQNFEVPDFDLQTIRIQIQVNSDIHTVYVPKDQPKVILERLKINVESGSWTVDFDNSPLGFMPYSENMNTIFDRFDKFLEGDLQDNNSLFHLK